MTVNKKNQYYIVRAARAGVFFGKIAERSAEEIRMTEVRKIWYWDGASAVEQLAVDGVSNPRDCKFTITVPEMVISEPIQIIPCTQKATDIIKEVEEWKM